MAFSVHMMFLASLGCLLLGQYGFVSGHEGCDVMSDPYEERTHTARTASDCHWTCIEETDFRCQSVYYSSSRNQCILSENFRMEPLLPSDDSDFKYFERPRHCGEMNLVSRITACDASSEWDRRYECQYAYDGNSHGGAGTEWATKTGEGLGGWIQVTLDKQYILTAVRIKHRCHRYGQVSSWQIQLQYGVEVQVSRPCGGTNSWTDCSGESNDWFLIELPVNIHSNYVRLIVTGVCATSRYAQGIRELEIIGYP